jgi:hypothetical protein
MAKVLVMCKTDPTTHPRIKRMIDSLREKHIVTVIGNGPFELRDVDCIFWKPAKTKSKLLRMFTSVNTFFKFFFNKFDSAIWAAHIKEMLQCWDRDRHFDVIVSEDIRLLPFAFAIQNDAKVVFDAREFYPSQFEQFFFWRLSDKKYYEHLCKNYLHRCAHIFTVSNGLVEAYKRSFNVTPDLLMSCPDPVSLVPSEVEQENIRIIYHGQPFASRRIHKMIEVMHHTDSRFSLDLMLVPPKGKSRYFRRLQKLVSELQNVRIIPPVKMEDICAFTNSYDIGLHLLAPTNTNNKYALPNKLFEFIQARLAVLIGPSIEMAHVVNKYDCGRVSNDFSPKSVAEVLNALSIDDIVNMKNNSDQAAKVLNSAANKELILNTVSNLLKKN